MQHSLYASLGNSCHANGTSFVSNHKYLPPLDPVYFQRYTDMARYPGQSTFEMNKVNGKYPEYIKTFYSKNTNPVMDKEQNTVNPQNPPIPIKSGGHKGTCSSCSGGEENDKGLYPILDPMFNLREVAKHLILLEDHLFHSGKRCTQCIIKHLLTIEAFLEEAITLDKEQKYTTKINNIYTNFKNVQNSIHDKINKNSLSSKFCENIAQQLRDIRKPISLETYNLC